MSKFFRKSKKTFAVLLTIAFVLSMVAVPVFAQTADLSIDDFSAELPTGDPPQTLEDVVVTVNNDDSDDAADYVEVAIEVTDHFGEVVAEDDTEIWTAGAIAVDSSENFTFFVGPNAVVLTEPGTYTATVTANAVNAAEVTASYDFILGEQFDVTFEEQNELAGVSIDVFYQDTETWAATATTGLAGTATVSLFEGLYDFEATLADYEDYEGSFGVDSDRTVEFTMTEEPDPIVVDERVMEGTSYSARPVGTHTTGFKYGVSTITVEADGDSYFMGGETQRLLMEVPSRTAIYIAEAIEWHDYIDDVTVEPRGTKVTDDGVNDYYREYIFDVTFADADFVIEDEDVLFKFEVDLWTAAGYVGDVEASFSGSPGSLFSADELVFARIAAAALTMEVREINFITDSNIENNIGTLRFTENLAGAYDKPVELKLPRGFYWDTAVDEVIVEERYGMNFTGRTTIDVEYKDRADVAGTRYRTVVLDFSNLVNENVRSSWDVLGIFDVAFTDVLQILVDPAMAAMGEVDATVTGAGPSPQTIAIYGDYAAAVDTLTTPTLLSGKFQTLGEFEIREDIAGSLVKGRTITLTLPEGAKWPVPAGVVDEDLVVFRGMTLDPADAPSIIGAATERRGLEFGTRLEAGVGNEKWQVVDNERRTIKTTILESSDTAARAGALLVFEKGKVALNPDFRDELVVVVGGSAGAAGEVILGDVVPSVYAEITDVVELEYGKSGQAIGDITLTESKAGAASRTGLVEGTITLEIPLPYGATFTSTPEAEVTAGDMIIERIWRSADRTAVNIQVAASSDVASGIVISGLELTIDRAAPDGPIHLHVKGNALIDPLIPTSAYFLDADVLHDLQVGEIVEEITPVEVMLWIGSTTYTSNGVSGTMDVAPFIEDDRTFVPVRFVAQGLGVSEDDIGWSPEDGLTEWVTIEHDGKLITITIGDPVIVVEEDGVTRTVVSDVAAQIINDRTFLPLRAVGEILGAQFDWGPKETLTEWVSFTYWK